VSSLLYTIKKKKIIRINIPKTYHDLFLECNSNEFKCNTGSECIPKTQVCDNVAQCTDRSDEWQCVQLDGVQLFAKYIFCRFLFCFSLIYYNM